MKKVEFTLAPDLAAEFKSVVKGLNFVTPKLLGYCRIKNGVAELTRGEFLGKYRFGVTVVRFGEHDFDACKSFNTRFEAEIYCDTLTHR